ncbi:MAG: hypothetical protein M3498_15745 [Deinococcota bacterium]|jgi:hypothetical protein|nr:hypothetical protein [Deinococcota bacterium]MDQ3460733.1 hypothetical protein [Deinococcota bacterium]
MAKVYLKPDEHGNLLVPKNLLGESGEDVVYRLEREGKVIRLEPAPRKLHDIADPEERARAVAAFMKRIAHKTDVRWPEHYNARDDIYD